MSLVQAARIESAVSSRLSRGARPCASAPARIARATETESPATWAQPSTWPERQSGSGNVLSSAIASSYAAIAESHDARRNHCSPRRNALSAGSVVEPSEAVRNDLDPPGAPELAQQPHGERVGQAVHPVGGVAQLEIGERAAVARRRARWP